MLRLAAALTALACLVAPATAQVQRAFPQNALRGAIVIGVAPDIPPERPVGAARAGFAHPRPEQHDGRAGRSHGGRFLVNYNVDTSGLVKEVWILRPEEAAVQPWPTTPDQAQAWNFDPVGQFWTKP